MAEEKEKVLKEIRKEHKELSEKSAKYPTPNVERPVGAQDSSYRNQSGKEESSSSGKKEK